MPECQVCRQEGRTQALRNLSLHLFKSHRITGKQYREQFGQSAQLIEPGYQINELLKAQHQPHWNVFAVVRQLLEDVPGELTALQTLGKRYRPCLSPAFNRWERFVLALLCLRLRELRGLKDERPFDWDLLEH